MTRASQLPLATSLFVAAIILSSLMVMGYAVLDEVALIIIVGSTLAFKPSRHIVSELLQSWRGLRGLAAWHHWVFLGFLFYLAVQGLRGAAVFDDIRILRFSTLFFFVAIAYCLLRTKDFGHRTNLGKYVTYAGIFYFVTYCAFGIIYEWSGIGWRFDLQGHYWSGTAAAFFPILLLIPAIYDGLSRDRSGSRAIFWMALLIAIFAGFYYQSRLAWLVTGASLLCGWRILGRRQTAYAFLLYIGFVILFPWHVPKPLTPAAIAANFTPSDVWSPKFTACTKIVRFANANGGAALIHIPQSVCGLDQVIEQLEQRVRRGELPEAAKQAAKEKQDELEKLAGFESKLADLDRKVAMRAAVLWLEEAPTVSRLFGDGYYAHREVLVEPIRRVSTEYGYAMPEIYHHLVRTAFANALLVDSGLVGAGLLAALLVLIALQLLLSASPARFVGLVCLAGVVLALITAQIGDLVLLYLTIMPGGPLLAMIGEKQLGSSKDLL